MPDSGANDEYDDTIDRIPVVDLETSTEGYVIFGLGPWRDLNEWVKAHGLDPMRIVARGGITRDAVQRRISYVEFIYNDEGLRLLEADGIGFQKRPAVAQLEDPPLPFPESVTSRLSTRQEVLRHG